MTTTYSEVSECPVEMGATANIAHDLRNKMVAHYNKNLLLKSVEVKHLNVKELEELKDKFNFVLDSLSFNVGYEMLPLPYSNNVIRPEGIKHRSDLDGILDSIAKNSVVLNMPEVQPEAWKYTKENFNEDQMEIINKYRKKFNLPEA